MIYSASRQAMLSKYSSHNIALKGIVPHTTFSRGNAATCGLLHPPTDIFLVFLTRYQALATNRNAITSHCAYNAYNE